MVRTDTRRLGTGAKIALALLAGFVALLLLFPGSGIDTLPPHCYSMFGYEVPCGGGGLAVTVAAAAGVLVFLAMWLWDKRR